jgi:hypothetical protein
MKKLFCLTLVLVLGLQLHAQEGDSKKWLISMNTPAGSLLGNGMILPGSIGFVSITDDNSTTNMLSLGGSFGYKVIDNLYAGINLTYANQSDDDFSVNNLFVGPQARYYVPFGSSSAFISVNAGFGSAKDSFDGEDFTTNLVGFGGALGYAYSINSTFDLEAQISYDAVTATYDDDNESDTNFLGIRLGFSIHL